MEIQRHLEFRDLFPEEKPHKITQYLEEVSRNDLIKFALYFIHVDKYDEVVSYVDKFISDFNPHFARTILNGVNILQKKDAINNNYCMLSRITGLKLLQYIYATKPTNVTNKNNSEIILDITKAICLINQYDINEVDLDNRGVNQDSILTSIHDDGGTEDFILAKNYFCNQVLYSDFVNYPLKHLAIGQILKAFKFFEFSKTNRSFYNLLTELLKEYQCDFPEYLECIMRLIAIVLDSNEKEGFPIIRIPTDEKFGLQVLNSISLKIDEIILMESNYDSLTFRNKPLIKKSDNEYYIINRYFVIERLYNSMKFNINTINEAKDPVNRVIKDLFSDYTTYFSEGFLFNQTIKNVYRGYNYKCKEGGKNTCDYFVQSGNKVFLFECKDIEYASNIKQSNNFNVIKEYIWKKLVSKDGRPVGIGQIIRDVKCISDGKSSWSKNLPGNIQVFPILILGKPIYSTLGFNYMLNYWFKEELLKEKISGRIKVRPLVIIDMDILLLLEDSLSSKRLKLETEIENYYKFTNKKLQYDQKFLSFSDYIINNNNSDIFSKSSRVHFKQILTTFSSNYDKA